MLGSILCVRCGECFGKEGQNYSIFTLGTIACGMCGECFVRFDSLIVLPPHSLDGQRMGEEIRKRRHPFGGFLLLKPPPQTTAPPFCRKCVQGTVLTVPKRFFKTKLVSSALLRMTHSRHCHSERSEESFRWWSRKSTISPNHRGNGEFSRILACVLEKRLL